MNLILILWRPLCLAAVCLVGAGVRGAVAQKQTMFEIHTRRMDVDVDGAPNAYGPPGRKTLDFLKNARLQGRRGGEIVGFLTDDDDPKVPVVQGPRDPYPGYYISQTSYTDKRRKDPKDPLRYVDATRINYVVLGDEARRQGARIGDFVAVYSKRNKRAVFGIVADEGNPSGDEGSLHLLQALGYPFLDGKDDSVENEGEIVVRFFPRSNPQRLFFRNQMELDAAAEKKGIDRVFVKKRASKR